MCLIKLDPRLDVAASIFLRLPGDVLLRDYMLPLNLNHAQLGRRSGIRAQSLKAITSGARRITPEIALRLACVLEPTAFYWMVLQVRYDLEWTRRLLTAARVDLATKREP